MGGEWMLTVTSGGWWLMNGWPMMINVVQAMPCLPRRTGNGKYTAYKKWWWWGMAYDCFTHITPMYTPIYGGIQVMIWFLFLKDWNSTNLWRENDGSLECSLFSDPVWIQPFKRPLHRINGHFRNLTWGIYPIEGPCRGYASGFIWHSTSILGSWNFRWQNSGFDHFEARHGFVTGIPIV